jgi:hypothetical protein
MGSKRQGMEYTENLSLITCSEDLGGAAISLGTYNGINMHTQKGEFGCQGYLWKLAALLAWVNYKHWLLREQ